MAYCNAINNNVLCSLVHDQQPDTSLVIGNWRLFFRIAVLFNNHFASSIHSTVLILALNHTNTLLVIPVEILRNDKQIKTLR